MGNNFNSIFFIFVISLPPPRISQDPNDKVVKFVQMTGTWCSWRSFEQPIQSYLVHLLNISLVCRGSRIQQQEL